MHFSKKYPLFLYFSTFGVLAATFISCASHPSSIQTSATATLSRTSWVETTLARLSLEEKISQMVMPAAYGYYYSSQDDGYLVLDRLVKSRKVGGFVFLQGDVYETAAMVNHLQEISDVPLLISSDFEWGSAMRVRRATRFPEAMAVGATRDTALAFAMGRAIGEESRALGVEQVFAPVVDVNVNPDNPVINTRSFGEDPNLVTAMAGAFVSGLQSRGVLATAKHFPGHGDTRIDSHLDLPSIDVTRQRLDTVELMPFKNLIRREIASVMIAHLEVPAVERSRPLPATLSPDVTNDLLRRQLGFNGLAVTDAMEMGAIVNRFGIDSSAIMAVEAGNDILLMLPDADLAVSAIARSVRTGRIPEERVNASVRRILADKWDAGLVANRKTDLLKIGAAVSTPEHEALAKQIAREAITVLRNDSVLPLEHAGDKKILNLIVSDQESYRTETHRSTSPWPNEPVGDYFTAQLRKRYARFETVRVDPTSNDLDYDDALKKAKNSGLVLCTIFSKARSGSGKFGLPDPTVAFLNYLPNLGTPVVAVAMGSPYILSAVPNARAYICSYSDCEPITEAAVEALFGEIPASGKLPVTIPKLFPVGTGIECPQSSLRRESPLTAGFDKDSLAQLDSVMVRAIRDSAFPGAELLVAKSGAVVYNKAFGRLEYADTSHRVNTSTMYDLASVTKVIATTSAVMKLFDEGKLGMDDPVVHYIPEFGNHGKEKITVRNLLVHNGGLPPFKRLFLTCKTPQQVLDSVYQTELVYRTGDSTVYSDFDFILLGKIVERISGKTLDEYVRDAFFRPLKMDRTMFKPPETLKDNIAPTEFDSLYRKMLVRGVVHDENADALGGVSGHAGLFSTASDLAVFMQMLMNGGSYEDRRFFNPKTVELFTSRQTSTSSRALGWDTKSPTGYSSAGSLFGDKSFGHTGFTGTSIWTDPERKLFVILLTNRVYPTRNNMKIAKVRPAVHDAVVRALTADPTRLR